MKAQKLVLAGAVLFLLAGCGTTQKQVVRRSEILSPTGQPIAVVRTQYVVPREEDPLVAQARAIGRQQAQARERWKAACLALRQSDPYATYNTCRQLLGDDRNLSTGYGYYGGQSILSTPGIVWR